MPFGRIDEQIRSRGRSERHWFVDAEGGKGSLYFAFDPIEAPDLFPCLWLAWWLLFNRVVGFAVVSPDPFLDLVGEAPFKRQQIGICQEIFRYSGSGFILPFRVVSFTHSSTVF